MRRRGLGKGMGRGYRNLVYRDPYVHSMSARGVKLHIEPTYVPRGKGNDPTAGKKDLAYKIREWGFIFPSKESAEKYAREHIEINGEIVEKKNLKSKNIRIDQIYKDSEGNLFRVDEVHASLGIVYVYDEHGNLHEIDIDEFRKEYTLKASDIKEKIKSEQERVRTKAKVRLLQDIIEGRSPKEIKERQNIISEGITALGSLMEIRHAVSTPHRFEQWASERHINTEFWDSIDRKSWNKDEPIWFDGKNLYPVEEFKQTGYGAWHIGSAIQKKLDEGKEILIINTRRNRRFLYAER